MVKTLLHRLSDASEVSGITLLERLKRSIRLLNELCVEHARLMKEYNRLFDIRVSFKTEVSTDSKASLTANGGGGWGYTLECGNKGLPNKLNHVTIDIEKLEQYWKQETIWNTDRQLWQGYATSFSALRDKLVTEKKECRTQIENDMLSILLASIPHDKWKGRLSAYTHDSGINGNTLYRCDGKDYFLPILKASRYPKQKQKSERVSISTGQILTKGIGHSSYSFTLQRNDPLTMKLSKDCRIERVLHSKSSILTCQKYVDRYNMVLSPQCRIPTEAYYRTELSNHVIKDWTQYGASVALTRLCRSVLANHSTGVFTVPISRPTIVGNVTVNEVVCSVYRFNYVTDTGSGYDFSRFCYGIGRVDSIVTMQILNQIDIVHDSIGNVQGTEYSMEVLNGHNVTILQQRIDYLLQRGRVQVATEQQRRKEISDLALKLLRLRHVSMLDSKAVGNCLPGTIAFCRSLGVSVPDEWQNVMIDSRQLLRAWKASNYKPEFLFGKLVNQTYDKLIESTVKLTCYY